MKWSTLVAIGAGGTAAVVAAIALQLWSLNGETPAVNERNAAGRQEAASNGAQTVISATDSPGIVSSSSDPDTPAAREQAPEPNEATVAHSGHDVEKVADTNLPTADGGSEAIISKPSTTRVSGDIGNLAFKRQARVDSNLPSVEATTVAVVSDDGRTFTFSSSNGEPVIVTQGLDDGLYKWEAVHKPDLNPRVREEMAAVRQSGDFAAERELERKFRKQGLLPTQEEIEENVQSGSFRVANGQLVDSTVPEKDSD